MTFLENACPFTVILFYYMSIYVWHYVFHLNKLKTDVLNLNWFVIIVNYFSTMFISLPVFKKDLIKSFWLW